MTWRFDVGGIGVTLASGLIDSNNFQIAQRDWRFPALLNKQQQFSSSPFRRRLPYSGHRCGVHGSAMIARPGCSSNDGIGDPDQELTMKKIFAIIAVAAAVSVSGLPAFAQGSNQATDNALSWEVAGGHGSTFGNAYARYGHVQFPRRAYGYVPGGGTIPQAAIDFQEQGSH